MNAITLERPVTAPERAQFLSGLPKGRLIEPDEFLPVAEASRMMLPIGPQLLTAVTFPAHLMFYVMVRSGVTRQWRDAPMIFALVQ